MFITKKHLHRRTFLKAAGASLALPLLDAMVPASTVLAKTAASPASRLGFVYLPHGAIMDKWTPAQEGANFEFSPILKPLEPFREYVNVFGGLAQVNGRALGDGPGDHARATATFLTGVHPYKTGGADFRLAISADQIAAKELGRYTQLSSLELGLEPQPLAGNCDSGYTCAYMSMSWRGRPVRCRPKSTRARCSSGCLAMATVRIPRRAWPGSRDRWNAIAFRSRSWHTTTANCSVRPVLSRMTWRRGWS